uniref:clp protease proteolytic subunit n=1 Tax=Balanophora yakushimensis TaxID=1128105 RepID=UPI002000663D|nr:clp protease proteolytic subunit [Balanophora yakushimensis]UNQ87786.1 clp protease proteolytic subunit [Balanophora yakushimensis]
MPIGIPKIFLKKNKYKQQFWIDIYNRLYIERFIFLGYIIYNNFANQLIALFIFLSKKSELKDINLFINSPGGYLISGISIYDIMQYIKPNIRTICIGLAASIASIILVGGEINKRISFFHSKIMMHQPGIFFIKAQVKEFILEAEELLKLREIITNIYSKKTGKSFWIISEDIEKDIFMSSYEAKIYGIIDFIIIKKI